MSTVGQLYERHVLPRLVDVTCANPEMRPWRRRALEGLSGRAVEIGFGSGTNVDLYPDEVTRVLAVEPSDLAWKRATERMAELRAEPGVTLPIVERVGLDGQALPLADASCDGAVSAFTLCTVPDPTVALAELWRVLRPGAQLHLLEHGRADDPGVLRWQQRFEPVQRRIAGGCHLTRDVVELAEAAGFEVEVVDQRFARGPKPWTWFTVARATRPDVGR
jgi:ubiquinone/menaquinone biosynthesis C-methylase UbiE